jgi:ABC-2 type transport system ATP-binding protein
MNAIEIVNLTKFYGKIGALNKMSLEVPEGTIYGLLGPNGSGKTTLIKALVGSLRPNAGQVKVLGLDPLER